MYEFELRVSRKVLTKKIFFAKIKQSLTSSDRSMTKLNIKPLFDNVVIEPLAAEEKTASGIILPDSAKEKPQIGIVVAAGPGNTTPKGDKIPMVVKVGDKVMYKKWGGDEFKDSGKEYIMVKQPDILAIL